MKDWDIYLPSKWEEQEDVERRMAQQENIKSSKIIIPIQIVKSKKEQAFEARRKELDELKQKWFSDKISADEYNEQKILIFRKYL